jgi:hypothetical protein
VPLFVVLAPKMAFKSVMVLEDFALLRSAAERLFIVENF